MVLVSSVFRVPVRMTVVVSIDWCNMLSFHLRVAVRVIVAGVCAAAMIIGAVRVTHHHIRARAMSSAWLRMIMPVLVSVLMVMLTNMAVVVVMPLVVYHVSIRSSYGRNCKLERNQWLGYEEGDTQVARVRFDEFACLGITA